MNNVAGFQLEIFVRKMPSGFVSGSRPLRLSLQSCRNRKLLECNGGFGSQCRERASSNQDVNSQTLLVWAEVEFFR